MEPGIARVRTLIATAWPHRFDPDRLDEPVELGEGGLGLDSVEIVELAFACEELSGREVEEALFEGEPVTLGRFSSHFWPQAA